MYFSAALLAMTSSLCFTLATARPSPIPRRSTVADAVTPANTTVQPPSLFYLQTQVVDDLPDCGTNKDGLWLYSFHTGAGQGDAVLSANKSYAMQAYLNGTQQFFTYPNNTVGPWPLRIGYIPYSMFYYPTISLSESAPPTQGFFYNETGLQFAQSGGGWIVCDWWHGAPQLFNLFQYEAAGPSFSYIPTSCSKVNLLPVAVDE